MKTLENVIVASLILAATITGSVYYLGGMLTTQKPQKVSVEVQKVSVEVKTLPAEQKKVKAEDPLKLEIRAILARHNLPSDNDYLYHVSRVESNGGEFLHQFRGGPGVGYYQFSLGMARRVLKKLGMPVPKPEVLKYLMTFDLEYQTVLARRQLFRLPQPIPEGLIGQATLWKSFHNSFSGKGTLKDFMDKNRDDLK